MVCSRARALRHHTAAFPPMASFVLMEVFMGLTWGSRGRLGSSELTPDDACAPTLLVGIVKNLGRARTKANIAFAGLEIDEVSVSHG
jgi:hypothetical protein